MDCSPPGSSLYGILQARVLEWVSISFSRGSFWCRDRTRVSCIPGRHFNLWATREAFGTMDLFQIGKGIRQGCILSLCLFNFMESISWEMTGWMKHQLESRLPGEISIISDMQMPPPLWPLDESERREWKSILKLSIQKTKIMASDPITSWQIDREIIETVTNYFLGLQNHWG